MADLCDMDSGVKEFKHHRSLIDVSDDKTSFINLGGYILDCSIFVGAVTA